MKWIKLGYLAAALAVVAAIVLHNALNSTWPQWTPLLAAVLLLWPAARHVRRNATRIIVSGDKLRYQMGLFSTVSRTIQLSKIQDVRVDQSLGQRLSGIGDLTIETAGETSRLTIAGIDSPRQTADRIMEASQTRSLKTE
jgi:uncharacterized membrane protein YdbT with pleckstrin-like domain